MKIVLDEGAFEPVRGHEKDAGMDLRTPFQVTIPKNGSAVIDIGVHFELPEGCYGRISGRSGLNVKYGIICPDGVVDEGFTGSVMVKLYNLGDDDYTFYPGDKVAQMVIEPYIIQSDITVVDHLQETDRGDNGFGSTGR